MSRPYKDVDSNAIIADIQKVAREHGPVTRVQYRRFGTFSERKITEKFGGFFNAVQAAGGKLVSKGTPTLVETNEVSGNKWEITLPKTRIHTLDELLEHCKVDKSIWKVDSFTVNKWEMGFKDSDGKAAEHPLFQVKAILKRDAVIASVQKELAFLKKEAMKLARVPKVIIRPSGKSGNLLEINIPDAHFGKLAWGRETGWEPYDTTIAEKTYLRALETLLDRVKHFKFDHVLFVVGNDLLNSDDTEARTTKGTVVTTDVRYQKTFQIVRKTITNCIERLREIAPVKVMMVSGNHDQLSVWHLGESLECVFAKYKDVEIQNEPTYRKYHEHGEVMLMFTHGDKAKRTDYPLLMAQEQREMWGRTRFKECHTGHTHMTKTDEQHGVRVRVLPALCPPDDWHAEQGYVGNLRSAEAYIWNRNEGLIAQVFHNEDALVPIETKVVIANG
jgi:predicted phosphodiesterase